MIFITAVNLKTFTIITIINIGSKGYNDNNQIDENNDKMIKLCIAK